MRVRIDQDADALYIRLDEATVVESEEVSPGIVLDFDDKSRVVGIEVLDLKRRFPDARLKDIDVEVA